MKTVLTLAKAEFKLYIRRPIFWISLIALAVLVQFEFFPNSANFNRLTYLNLSAYAAFRAFFVSMPLVAIIAAILTSGQAHNERRLGMDAVLWATPEISPAVYCLGKWLGAAVAFTLHPLAIGLVSLSLRVLFYPGGFEFVDYLKATVITGWLPLLFAVTLGFCLGTLFGSRVAGVSLTLYFFWSDFSTIVNPVTGAIPVYRFMGDLRSLVFLYPGWQYNAERVVAGWQTLAFELAVILAMLSLAWGMIARRSQEVLR